MDNNMMQDERYEDMYYALHGHFNGTTDSECSLCNALPAENFAVVKDIERNLIVYSGTWQECYDEASAMNYRYQSTAHVAQGWNH